ncbi:MAG TPA: crosslink repair DNA glycosylase YcaQ family protein [Gaiellaceae bacterium]|nr:crosslink repair DNA glycosylase YcaQ family protein [Gaiellaceae bacterium]
MRSRLALTRQQIVRFRRRVNGLDERMPHSATSLRRAAWAGLQDSMPRAALLSLHARVESVAPSDWEHPSLAQLWGPRYQTYVVPARDFALFSLARLPETESGRRRAEHAAALLRGHAGRERRTDRELARALGVGPGSFRYAATTGTIAIRWDGARAPLVWTVPAPAIDPRDARVELARRYLHIFGPSAAVRFARWAGIAKPAAAAAFASLEDALVPVRTPLGDEWLLATDEEAACESAESVGSPRLLPSGDAYFLLLSGEERELLLPRADRRQQLWTSRVWPGALLLGGEIRGTWRRATHTVRISTWGRLSAGERAQIEAEALGLPLPGIARSIEVVWEG